MNEESLLHKITNWYNHNNDEITWFLVGFLCYATLDDLYHQNYISAYIDFILVLLNVKFYRDRV
jgi:hypothetical protein